MRKLRCALSAGVAALLFSLPSAGKGDLKEITKPHLGVYECTEAHFGEMDCLGRFSYIRLELKSDDTYILHFCEREGKPQTQSGQYTYDCQQGTLLLQGGGFKREFPLEKGVLTVVIPFGDRTLGLKFEQK